MRYYYTIIFAEIYKKWNACDFYWNAIFHFNFCNAILTTSTNELHPFFQVWNSINQSTNSFCVKMHFQLCKSQIRGNLLVEFMSKWLVQLLIKCMVTGYKFPARTVPILLLWLLHRVHRWLSHLVTQFHWYLPHSAGTSSCIGVCRSSPQLFCNHYRLKCNEQYSTIPSGF